MAWGSGDPCIEWKHLPLKQEDVWMPSAIHVTAVTGRFSASFLRIKSQLQFPNKCAWDSVL